MTYEEYLQTPEWKVRAKGARRRARVISAAGEQRFLGETAVEAIHCLRVDPPVGIVLVER